MLSKAVVSLEMSQPPLNRPFLPTYMHCTTTTILHHWHTLMKLLQETSTRNFRKLLLPETCMNLHQNFLQCPILCARRW